MGPSRYVIVLLTFVTIGMAGGALLQLAYLKRLEESSGSGLSNLRRDWSDFDNQTLASGLSLWHNDEGARTLRVGLIKQEIISWQPRIILLHNFLSADECDHLISVARPRLVKSTVVDANTGYREHRTIQAVENRISAYSMIPVENGELLQVLRYESDQYYKAHHDYFSDEFNLKRGGQRVATMLMYLTEGVEGGETIFPGAGDKECSCGGEMRRGVCVKPKRGDAVLFWSMKLDGSVDPSSLHGGCKVLVGEKWSSTKWMRQRSFE